ncbi:Uncharacterised protein [Enterobacter hormaechei]|nr:hypothetical protein AZZ90_003900 [Enterobacter hormaechei]SAA99763.1 Uncharacterised protein [Enterobacter hormaechei]SAF35662.1 Uncharacterised protein [Enterobacter hormaechei]SAG92038.1 Uncharacterised protein [Enterobacter hormaechei]
MKTLIIALMMFSAGAIACPRGEHIHGGYNNHHKGGYCSYYK